MTEREWLFLFINAIGWVLAGFALYCTMKQVKKEAEARKAAEAARAAKMADAFKGSPYLVCHILSAEEIVQLAESVKRDESTKSG